jgi:hypothetical protein
MSRISRHPYRAMPAPSPCGATRPHYSAVAASTSSKAKSVITTHHACTPGEAPVLEGLCCRWCSVGLWRDWSGRLICSLSGGDDVRELPSWRSFFSSALRLSSDGCYSRPRTSQLGHLPLAIYKHRGLLCHMMRPFNPGPCLPVPTSVCPLCGFPSGHARC